MDTARYKAFIVAAEEGSISKAAEKLGYTPSGISQLLKALETDLGIALLNRGKKGVRLTEAGENLLPDFREIVRLERNVFDKAQAVNGLERGSVVIASYPSVSVHWLPEVIKKFQDDYPGVRINVREGVRQEITDWLDQGVADIAFFTYKEGMPYDWIPLAEDRMVAVIPQNHPLAGRTSYPLSYCNNEKFIMPALGRDEDVLALFHENHIHPEIRFSTQESVSVLSMVEKGLGMSIMNELSTEYAKEYSKFNVVRLPVDPPQSITVGIALRSEDQAAPATKMFIKYAVRELTRNEVQYSGEDAGKVLDEQGI